MSGKQKSSRKRESKKKGPKASDYGGKTDRQWVLDRPDSLIGSIEKEEINEWIVDPKNIFKKDMKFRKEINNYSMVEKKIEISYAIIRMFAEILTNATDNVKRTRRKGEDPGKIYINIDNRILSLKNGGLPIPIKKKEYTIGDEREKDYRVVEEYAPEFIFGNFKAGSNFGKEDFENNSNAGKNGVGAKAVNAYSDTFKVEVYDAERGKYYVQEWADNMLNMSEPTIENYNKSKSYVIITYELDFERFGLYEYTQDIIAYYVRMCVDASFTCKIPIVFNGNLIDFSNYNDYFRLYFPEIKNFIYHRDDENEIVVLDTPMNAKCLAFSNCLYNSDGGVHKDIAYDIFCRHLVNIINKDSVEKGNNTGVKVTIADAKKNISVIVSVHVGGPMFKSQSKLKLTGPKNIKFGEISERRLNEMKKWDSFSALKEALDFKLKSKFKQIIKGVKRTTIKYKDAENAGKKGKYAILGIAEGDSAYNTILDYKNTLSKEDQKEMGAFALRGKMLNAKKKEFLRMIQNNVILNLHHVIGLDPNITYENDRDYNKLRYRQIMLFADADVDGHHIRGLVIAYFDKYHRPLLERGFVIDFRTPYLKIYKGIKSKTFIYPSQYHEWLENNDPKGWKSFYIKGLASIKKDEKSEDLRKSLTVNMIYDKRAKKTMDLFFGNGKEDDRKRMLLKEKEDIQFIEEDSSENGEYLSNFLYHNLRDYSLANVRRCIPHIIDGLKPVQRKVLYTLLYKTYGFNCYKGNYKDTGSGVIRLRKSKLYKTDKKEAKIERLSSTVSGEVGYHHGEPSMQEAIFKMGHEYIGSNNLPYLREIGDFGDRSEYGKNRGAARYTDTMIQWWLKYCYPQDDINIFNFIEEDGETGEPEYLLPIIPMVLVNGAKAIATGWSTTIPNFNPFKIIDWYLNRIEGNTDELEILEPWYYGFKGSIIPGKNKKKKKKLNLDEKEDFDDLDELKDEEKVKESLAVECDVEEEYDYYDNRYISTGILEIENNLIIKELPIGVSTENYTIFLDKLKEEKKIKSYIDNSHRDNIHIEIKGYIEHNKENFRYTTLLKKLRLKKSLPLTNMVLIDVNGKPKVYETIDDILEDFYSYTKHHYKLRKKSSINKLEEELDQLDQKMRFVKAVLDEIIIIVKGKGQSANTDEIRQQMEEMQIDKKFLKIPITTITDKYKAKLEVQFYEKTNELDLVRSTHYKEMWKQDLLLFKEFLEANYDLMFMDTGEKKKGKGKRKKK